MPLWLKALATTLLMQAVASYFIRAPLVVGPVLTDAAGVDAEAIGYVAAATAAGTVWALTGCASALPRFGPLRLLQIGAGAGALGLVGIASGIWPVIVAAAFLAGVGYAPSPPAGSDILARHAPRNHQGLVFSVKQAGVPVGGVVAGLVVPAAMIALGWQAALAISAAGVLAVAGLIQPWRPALDRERDPQHRLAWGHFLSARPFTAPLQYVRVVPGLPMLTYAGFCFAVVQGSLIAFLVTYLATDLGLGLALGGLAFAAMQAAGSVGRVAVGWAADRVGTNRVVLAVLGLTSALVMAAVAAMDPGWSATGVLALSTVAGVAATGWNGIYLAEIARLAGEGRVAEATAGSTFFTFIGYTVGPAAFALGIKLTGSYGATFVLTALVPLTASVWLFAARGRPVATRT